MSRLIDRPGAQKTVTAIVNRNVLYDLLRTVSVYHLEHGDHVRGRMLLVLAKAVESGELVSLYGGDEWPGVGSGLFAEPIPEEAEWREIGGGE